MTIPNRLYILAFDHRGSFKRMFDAQDATPEQMEKLKDAKRVVWEGFQHAVDELGVSTSAAGILVDEEMGADIAREAAERDIRFAMPVEKSGQPTFDFEYGLEFTQHIKEFDPTFCKVLVRWNPGDSAEDKKVQGERLKELGDWLRANQRMYLFELLVPATDEDLAKVDGDQKRYDTEVRPALTVAAISEIQAAGVEPDIWKIEGLDDRADCEQLAKTIRSGPDRGSVIAVVLGRGADNDAVDHWLKQGAGVDGYRGFAIGRSIWKTEIEKWGAGDLSREDAAASIGRNFKRFVDVYENAS